MGVARELEVYLRARTPLIVLVTTEETRAEQEIVIACRNLRYQVVAWDLADGFEVLEGGSAPAPARDPQSALESIDKAQDPCVFVLRDFHECWNNPQFKRKLRNVSKKLRFAQKSIVVICPSAKVPEELRGDHVLLELPPPTAQELESVFSDLERAVKAKVRLTTLGREKLVQAALGMTATQARRAFTNAVVTSGGCLDDRHIAMIAEEKRQIIRESQALEYFPATETIDHVGGLDVLKSWLRLRERVFSADARNYGLPAPKGIALIGIPGTGKSLTAKMISGLWRLPLLRLDVGALFGSLVGESEERARRALRLVETIAPCILWIDEMEKALASGDMDGGTSRRVFGTILTWMQEKTAPCFVVATANDINKLPPELLRKGRFDEVFFLDLPTEKERREVFTVHLQQRKRPPQGYDIARLARAAEGYTGAEIEQAIVDAMFSAFSQDREFKTEDVEGALQRQVPLSISARETIQALRDWLREGRAQSASFQEPKEAAQQFVPIQPMTTNESPVT